METVELVAEEVVSHCDLTDGGANMDDDAQDRVSDDMCESDQPRLEDGGEVLEEPQLTDIITLDGKHIKVEMPSKIVNSDVTGSGKPTVLIFSPDGNVTALEGEVEDEQEETGEPATKRLRLEQDGNTYYFSMPDSLGKDTEIIDNETAMRMSQLQQEDLEPGVESSLEARIANRATQVVGDDTDVTQAWFTTRDDKTILQKKGHDWKQGQWSKEEVEILKANIAHYCDVHGIMDPTEIIFEMTKEERKDFYRTVSKNLQRPLFSVYRRVIRMYDQKNHMGKYTPQEIQQLKELRMKHGSDWAAIGAALGRSASSVKDRCRLMKDTCNSGKWLPEEEKRLAKAVYDQTRKQPGESVTGGLSWATVAEEVVTRSEKQCRTKWLNYLNWKQKGGTEWTREDDIELVHKLSNTGALDENEVDWGFLCNNWPSARSPQWLRGKWWTLKRHVPDRDLLSFQDLVSYLKETNAQTIKMRPPPNMRLTQLDLPRVSIMQNMSLSIPIVVPSASGSGGNVDVGVAANMDDSQIFQAYEVLTHLNANTGTPAYLTVASDGSTEPGLDDDHIIVHTLPITHDQEPSSEGEGEDQETAQGIHPLHQELRDLGGGEDPRRNVVTEKVELVAEHSHLDTAQFTQQSTNGDLLKKMATSKDPMLPSESELIGQSSDVEVEKSHAQEASEES